MYRLQVYDKNTTGMHWHLHKDGKEIYEKYKKLSKKMPVSVAIGCDPAFQEKHHLVQFILIICFF
jgi:4-hydroxy-3-polyprenylbenzoate decarboxylase